VNALPVGRWYMVDLWLGSWSFPVEHAVMPMGAVVFV
jgi:hypothetical protein